MTIAENLVDKKVTSTTLQKYLREISEIPLISAEKEKELGRLIQEEQDEEALNALVKANLRFVVSYSKKYRNCGMSFLDLINEGNIGLIEAAKRFDPNKNVKFITYAMWWIRQAILHALAEHGKALRLPQRQANLYHKIVKSVSELKSRNDRNPSPEEISEETGIPISDVNLLLQMTGGEVSLNEIIDAERDFALIDKIEQDSIPSQDDVLLNLTFSLHIEELLKELSEKERKVLELRYGLNGKEPKTLQEIGDLLGLSRERIRQVESEALKKLKKSHNGRQLRGYLN